MRKTIQLFLSTLFLLTISFTVSIAQEVKKPGYYYNNFEGGQLGQSFTAFGGDALGISSTNLGFGGGYSLSSSNAGVAGGYQFSFLPSGTDLNSEQFGYEWTMLYKNNGVNPDDSEVIDNGENAWKYWLFANNTNLADMKGYYLTQNGSNLELRLRVSSDNKRALISYDLSEIGGNNKTYAIRVQRIKRGGQFVWQMFVDQYTSAKKEASTPRGSLNYEANIFSVYNYSGLAASSTTNGRFQFDELKLYSMQLNISGANDVANGISNPLYSGLQNAVIYGLKVETRGLFDVSQMRFSLTGNISNVLEGTMKLNKSTDSYFGNTDDSFVANLDYFDSAIQNYNVNDSFYTTGQADGSLALAFYYYISANVKKSPTNGATFSISGVTDFTSSSSQGNFSNTNSMSNVSTPPTNTGKVYDWAGGKSTNWNDRENWKPNEVPGTNDLARIGVEGFVTENQPEVFGTATAVGNIQFGKANVKTLTLNGNMNVAGSVISPVAVSIQGDGTLAIGGAFLVRPIEPDKVITIAVKNLRVTNLVLNTEDKIPQFSIEAGSTVAVSNAIQTTGGSEAKLQVKGSGTLKLIGATPFNLTAKRNTFSLENGSTVEYAGNEKQEVRTADIVYKNISFTGSGSKLVATGELGVRGNWSSEGGKIDLITNNTDVVFYGDADQSITHIGDNDGLTFGNVNFTFPNTKTINTGTLTIRGNWSSKDGKVDLRSKNTKVVFDYKDQTIIDSESDSRAGVEFADVSFSGAGTKMIKEGNFAVGIGNYLMMGDDTILEVDKIATLTLKADDKGTASVAFNPENSSIQGQVTVEKYIQGGSKTMWRTNRMLSSPVYDNGNANNRTYSFSQFIDDMIITGKGGSTNGFDTNLGSATSAWTYVSGKSFLEIPNIKTSLNVGMGAYLFYRGDRTNPTAKVTSPFVDAESTVMTFKGILNQQDVRVPLAAANLVGNPYAATIDWNAVEKTGTVSNVIRIWNPSNRQYSTFNGVDSVNGGTRYIGPGQAFFVQATGSGASLTFTEKSKISNAAQHKPLYNIIMSTDRKSLSADFIDGTSTNFVEEQPLRIRAKLLRKNTENSDETLIVLKDGELATVAGYDVTRSGGEAVYLSSQSAEGKQMAINYMPSIANVSKIKLGVGVDHNGEYELAFSSENLRLGYEVKLNDHFLNTVTEIGLDEKSYSFTVDKSITASFGNNRFEIVFSPQTTLPVVVSSFNASKVNEGVLVKWMIASATNHSHFVLQRAGEDKVYEEIGIARLKQNGNYEFLDKSPLVGYNYYRLVQVDKDGKSVTGEPIVLNYSLNDQNTNGILVYPTVTNKSFTLKYNGALTSETYELKISEATGKNIFSKRLQKSVLTFGYQGELPSVSAGVYFVELLDISTGKSLGVSKIIKP